MASSGIWLTFSLIVLCTILKSVWSQQTIQCYECNVGVDPKCGKTWGYAKDDPEAKKYLKTCTGNTVACQKLENDGASDGYGVSRSCWSSDSDENYTPDTKKCQKMHQGLSCYCKGDKDGMPCNGKQLLMPQIAVILLGLSFLLWRYVF